MKTAPRKLPSFLSDLKSTLWFIPSLFTVTAALLAVVTIAVDRRMSDTAHGWFLFSAGAEGARGVLGTIAGSIMTVTGVVFSITIVALQLASTQYTPRVLRAFTEDRSTQIVLGIFIGTFTYSLLVLRVVRSEIADLESFVPAISVTLSVGMALASIAALIFFVNHIARSIRVENVMQRIATDVVLRIDSLCPDAIGSGVGRPASSAAAVDPVDESGDYPIRAISSGYLQQVDEAGLVELGDRWDIRTEMRVLVGDFVVEGDVLATVSPPPGGEDAAGGLDSLFQIGSERTLHQDLGRGLVELTDVALRALSPGVNDPTTAIGAIDRLTQLLVLLAGRRFPEPVLRGSDDRVRLVALRPTFRELLHLPFSQLRHSGAEIPAVAERMISSLRRIGLAAAASPDRRPGPIAELDELMEAIRLKVRDGADLARLERLGALARPEMQLDVPGGGLQPQDVRW